MFGVRLRQLFNSILFYAYARDNENTFAESNILSIDFSLQAEDTRKKCGKND